jgi:transcriptional regulator with XRE-family HTH domain
MKTLREARLAAGKTQLDIERETGIFQSKISREENGIRCLTVLEMIAVEKALSAEVDWIPRHPLTNAQQEEINTALFQMMRKYGELEALKFSCRFRSPDELYQVLCQRDSEEDPLELPDHRKEGK